jgi:hypothetical protein
VAALPVPREADPAAIERAVLLKVSEVLDTIPVPRDGKDGRDGKDFDAAEARRLVEAALLEVAPRSSEPVEIDAEALDAAARRAVEALPRPRDGRDGVDGRSVDLEVVEAIVARQVGAAVAALPAPRDGRDADPELIRVEVERAVSAIPRPKDGESVALEVVNALVVAEVTKAMANVHDGRDGQPGPPGRDAFAIDVLPEIDLDRRYQRGVWAKHAGGLWMAHTQTDGLMGWDCIIDGDAEEVLELGEDQRTLLHRKVKSSGRVVEHTFRVPTMIHREVWREGTEYTQGDAVTWGGGTWICRAAAGTRQRPGTGTDWFLAVKPGRDGKDGLRGEKGERGAEGKKGADLTQMDWDGRKS